MDDRMAMKGKGSERKNMKDNHKKGNMKDKK